MIRISSVKIPTDELNDVGFYKAVAHKLKIGIKDILKLKPVKISIDARKKENIFYVCSFDAEIKNETKIIKRLNSKDISKPEKNTYNPFAEYNRDKLTEILTRITGDTGYKRPLIVGSGPAGLICTYKLAEAGLKPILIERGSDVDTRKSKVDTFWNGGALDPDSNVQFGEGGAGTFSDGKLNTMIKDPEGRIKEVYRAFIDNGADESILYMNKPHIGTDRLCVIVKNLRNRIIALGGEVRFSTCLTDIYTEKDENGTETVTGAQLNGNEKISCDIIVLAIGHSARDTFAMLKKHSVPMEKKSFAVGIRVQHPQAMINEAQYGTSVDKLPAADYKLTCNLENGRSVYSFCMCPGGYVVNASSEKGRLCVNGMSYSGRNGKHANSAIVVSVSPDDYPGDDVLAGVEFQRRLEENAYNSLNGEIPVQCLKSFMSDEHPEIQASPDNKPSCKGKFGYYDLNKILPSFICESVKKAFPEFGRHISGFDRDDTLLLGLESRTSSPVRINRGSDFQSIGIKGLYPAGEGAGYAGGITSAAVDGLKIYENIIINYLNSEIKFEKANCFVLGTEVEKS